MLINYLKAKYFLLFLLLSVVVKSQELPPIQNFTAEQYQAQNQNWAITQSEDNTIFIANNKGLLEYNGANWRLYNSPNETIIRSVKAIGDKIYSGCYMDFGYWQRDNYGQLQYTSLTKRLSIEHKDDEQFWNILEIENWILFQSLNRIYLYNIKKELVKVISSTTTIVKMYKTSDGIYFQRNNDGLYKIENGKDILVSNDTVLRKSRIVNVFNHNGILLVSTQNNGFFKFSKNSLQKWDIGLTKLFPLISIYNSIQLKDGSYALGTISNGVIHIDKNGNFQYQINQRNGLNNNTILSLFEDTHDNIWLGLDNGISLINQKSSFKIYNDFEGNLGSVYASEVYDDNIYLGTNQGLFYRAINSNKAFRFIEGTQGQVWSIRQYGNTLFCGHDLGTFTITGNKAKKIINIEGTWDVKPLNSSESLLLQGNYDGLYILEKQNERWKIKNKIEGFNISSRFFEIFDDKIFINHEYKGVLKLKVDSAYSKVINIEKDSIEKGLNSSLVKFQDNLYYAYKKGIFRYNVVSQSFKKVPLLSTIYNDGFISGKLIADLNSQEMWGFSKNNIHQITPSKLSSELKINKIPLTNSSRKGVVGYENILKLRENNYLLASASGYIHIDISKFYQKDFKIKINAISKANYKQHIANEKLDLTKENHFKSTENSIKFSFNTTNFNKYLETNYQYKLDGFFDDWSAWSSNSSEFFENLPAGDYQFLVRAKVGNKISSNLASNSFSIAKPWYITNAMILIYVLLVLLFSVFMHTMYRRYYKRQQHKLVEKNERERRFTQVENEKEIIRIKNEQLQKEFKSKSKELATSIMNVAKKNEILTQIKEQLNSIQDKTPVNKVIQVINKNLKQADDWKLFKEAFDNIDSDFLKKIKLQHSALSPNDLKLCAYLRLNLSSKEIAPLFNISVRSVEIKRYRLRKKLNLAQKDNLVEYIMSV